MTPSTVARVSIEGREIAIEPGATVGEVLAAHAIDGQTGDPVVIAVVNGLRTSLLEPLWGGETVGLMRWRHPKSHSTVVRTLVTVLAETAHERFPDHPLVVEYAHGEGFYCRLEGRLVTAEDLASLTEGMNALRDADREIVPQVYGQRLLLRRMGELPHERSQRAARHLYRGGGRVYQIEGGRLLFHGLRLPRTGLIGAFALLPLEPGFLLLPCRPGEPHQPSSPTVQPPLLEAMRRGAAWNTDQQMADLGAINCMIANDKTKELIRICEARHEQELVRIARRVAAMPRQGRLVLLAGPSSSGKTTTAKRLALHLRVLGLRPFALSLDDYFVDRDRTPRDEKGEYDYETIDALRLDELNRHLAALLAGEPVRLLRYDFQTGRSLERERPVTLERGAPLIVEGLHGLNPRIGTLVAAGQALRIFVSAMSHPGLDNFSFVPPHLIRLFRRIVRDSQFRGYTASQTLRRWPMVRGGELKHIFPYQGRADVYFDSWIPYEPGVMKLWAEPRLAAVEARDPAYGRARALGDLLAMVLPVDPRLVPPTSLLREFIGESGFSY